MPPFLFPIPGTVPANRPGTLGRTVKTFEPGIKHCRSAQPMSLLGQSRRFGDVSFRRLLSTIPDIITSNWDRSAWLLPAPKLLTTGATAAAPAFCPRPDELHPRSTKTRGINCAKSARNLLAFCLSWFLSDGGLAKDSAGPARRRPPTA